MLITPVTFGKTQNIKPIGKPEKESKTVTLGRIPMDKKDEYIPKTNKEPKKVEIPEGLSTFAMLNYPLW